MADTFGAISLPVAVPGTGQPVSDPLVYHLGSFLQAIANAKATSAWQAVCPHSRPIENVYHHEPQEMSFNRARLPALFIWRDGGAAATEWIAEDYLQSSENVNIVWVWPEADQEKARIRHPIANALTKALTTGIELGRDPAWVVPSDTDPDAATWGSVLYRWIAISRIKVSKWQRRHMVIRLERDTQTYLSYEATIAVEELLAEDVAKYPACIGVNQTTTSDELVTNTAYFR